MMKDYFVLAIKNIRKRRVRSWLTMLGIFISIATIFTLVSLSLGLQGAVEEQFKILGVDKLFVMPLTGFLGPPGTVGGDILTMNDVDTIQKIRGVKDYSYYVAGNAKVVYGGEIKYLMVVGIPPDRLDIFKNMQGYSIAEGDWFKESDKYELITGDLLKKGGVFKKEVGLRDSLEINGERFKVGGILEQIGNSGDDSVIMMPVLTFRELFNVSERVDYIIVQVEEGEDINEVADRIEKKLRSERGQTEKTQDFSISTPEELLTSFQNILNIITYFLVGVAGISLIVGAIGITNTMYTSVLERTREIGVMKAVGARNEDILLLFLIESGLLGLIGGLIGVLLGVGLSKSLEMVIAMSLGTSLLKAATPMYLVLGCLAFGLIVGAFSGAFPARQASKTNVVDALRYE